MIQMQTLAYATVLKHAEKLDGDVCVFVTFAPDGILRPSAYAYYQEMLKQGISVVVCLVVSHAEEIHFDTRLDKATAIIRRENKGWDFAAWADVLRLMPQLWQVERLYFANDSVFCLPDNFEKTIARIRASQVDYIALTECGQIRHHTQSYFFVLQRNALTNERIRQYWQAIQAYADKKDVIRYYEVTFLEAVKEAGLLYDILFSLSFLFPQSDTQTLVRLNPTFHLWETLVYHGYPFIKVALITRPVMKKSVPHWKHVATEFGGDVLVYEKHINHVKQHEATTSTGLKQTIKKIARFLYTRRLTNKNITVIRLFGVPVFKRSE